MIPGFIGRAAPAIVRTGAVKRPHGAYLTFRRVTATERRAEAAQKTVEVAERGQITERFTRAIDQLGSGTLEVRLGGIYALERIARDSKDDHWTIMEALTAFVREKARAPREQEEEPREAERAVDEKEKPPRRGMTRRKTPGGKRRARNAFDPRRISRPF